tara:strand:- start:394 stop:1938 length:1545 start_codon:yes stop_codon:yes gene_type:complete
MTFDAVLNRGVNFLKLFVAARKCFKSTSEDQFRWAQQYLIELLGKSRGLPSKIGQFLIVDAGSLRLRKCLNSSLKPIPFEKVVDLIVDAYRKPFDTIFNELDRYCKTASLGQVHFGKLVDGTDIAVKVQYPEIAASVEAEMNFMGWFPKFGPVAKYGFDIDGYHDVFWHNLSEELNYRVEARHQENYRRKVCQLKRIVIPEVLADLSQSKILVQKKEEGFSLDKAETMMPEQKQAMGQLLLEHYLYMLFQHGFVHSDPQPDNFAFRQYKKNYFVLIIYDFGSVLEISSEFRLTLLRIILALRERENLGPLTCLNALGFDLNKLKDLRLKLPALMSILFEPFLVETPYNISDWRVNERFDQIAGDMKWSFYSSAPPQMIFLIRILHGLTTMLKRLDASLSWKLIMDNTLSDIYPQARALPLPEIDKSLQTLGFDSIARYLKVYVAKADGSEISLTMPGICANDIEGEMEESIKKLIYKHKVNLISVQNKIRKSGFVAQTLFELQDEKCNIKVWLE